MHSRALRAMGWEGLAAAAGLLGDTRRPAGREGVVGAVGLRRASV